MLLYQLLRALDSFLFYWLVCAFPSWGAGKAIYIDTLKLLASINILFVWHDSFSFHKQNFCDSLEKF